MFLLLVNVVMSIILVPRCCLKQESNYSYTIEQMSNRLCQFRY